MFHQRLFGFPICVSLQLTAGTGRSWIRVIDEHDTMTNEDLILDRHTFADEGMTRNLAAAADNGVLLNFNEGTNLGVIADFTSVQVDEVRELDAFSELDVGSNDDELVQNQWAPFPDSTARGVASRIFKSVISDERLA